MRNPYAGAVAIAVIPPPWSSLVLLFVLFYLMSGEEREALHGLTRGAVLTEGLRLLATILSATTGSWLWLAGGWGLSWIITAILLRNSVSGSLPPLLLCALSLSPASALAVARTGIGTLVASADPTGGIGGAVQFLLGIPPHYRAYLAPDSPAVRKWLGEVDYALWFPFVVSGNRFVCLAVPQRATPQVSRFNAMPVGSAYDLLKRIDSIVGLEREGIVLLG